MASAPASLEVILVGSGERASAWAELIARSPRLSLVARVNRHGAGSDEAPNFSSLREAMERFPSALMAVALPARSGFHAALEIAEAGRRGVVEAPLHVPRGDERAADLPAPPTGGEAVQVAHGLVTLPGRRFLEGLLASHRFERAELEIRGLPEAKDGDLTEVLAHALALVRRLFPRARLSSAHLVDGGRVDVELSQAGATAGSSDLTIALRALARGQGLDVRLEGHDTIARWRYQQPNEHLTVETKAGQAPPRKTLDSSRPAPPAEARALAQLFAAMQDPPAGAAAATAGDDLRASFAVARLLGEVRACLRSSPDVSSLPPPRRALRQSERIARARPHALLERLGLDGELAALSTAPAAPAAPTISLRLPPEPFELWPFRAGIKRVAFLTVRPHDVEDALRPFGDVFALRLERRVLVDAQDRWTDRRDVGEPRVELYVSRDEALARQAAQLQAEGDPTRSVEALGALMGYPPCCVAAFSRQTDRSNNTGNRYESYARTVPRDGQRDGDLVPWPFALNNLFTVVVPFYPCRYDCPAALAFARATLAEMARAHPDLHDELVAHLRHPVLYFDHDHQALLHGAATSDGNTVHYRGVSLPGPCSPAFARFAGALAGGDTLSLDDRWLRVSAEGKEHIALRRTDPALGFIAPFGPARE